MALNQCHSVLYLYQLGLRDLHFGSRSTKN